MTDPMAAPDSVRHSSRIKLSQSAVKANLNFIRQKVGLHAVISSVVKANAYGHGIAEFVPLAEGAGIRHFSVASSHEAQEVRAVCRDDSRIMIMGILYDEDLPWVVRNGIEFFVFDLARLEKAVAVAKEVGETAVVHLEVETGGNRTGLPTEQLGKALSFLKANRRVLRFEGLCTHFAGIETLANGFRITKQMRRFEAAHAQARKAGILPVKRHTASSAGALAFPGTVMDMVRVGTSQFGFWPSPDIHNMHLRQVAKASDDPLRRVLSWETDVMHLKKVPRGEFIGYGTSYEAPRDMTIAVLPIGYSNGYPRELSNRGHVLIGGKKAPVVGSINMNVFMVDVTNIPNVSVGDQAVLVGRQKNNSIALRSFSEFAHALNNELASRLPAAIPRTVVK